MRVEVNSSDPATVYTELPSERCSMAGSVVPLLGRPSDTERFSNTSPTSRLTNRALCSALSLTALTCRCASAWTCQVCQVERRSSIAAKDAAGCILYPAGVDRRPCRWVGVQCGVHHMLHRLRSAEDLAGLRQPGVPL